MEVELKIGKGYLVKDGKVIEKFHLPKGVHKFPDDVEVIECEDIETIQIEHETQEQKIPPNPPLSERVEKLEREISEIKLKLNQILSKQ
ncbi:hypothetical protein [Archaeoglobus veneficus]|uniref:Uncharacterized protein n=1 Tax=Archaeoglobus veneficus (strain DSM 11195 / SNP6) TaxID=693661 RepID=F2KSJ5_ARCVS|nr:hypothetical protein [Archaeoglobus veneficus]AEA48065.1 hypothetical protein Arcve_2075 [Archaeoglobus veneficus SNP6]